MTRRRDGSFQRNVTDNVVGMSLTDIDDIDLQGNGGNLEIVLSLEAGSDVRAHVSETESRVKGQKRKTHGDDTLGEKKNLSSNYNMNLLTLKCFLSWNSKSAKINK